MNSFALHSAPQPDAASTAKVPATIERVLSTCRQMIEQEEPNLLRLYLNPWVAQTCLCLSEIARPLFRPPFSDPHVSSANPSYLCNSRDEAISGAVKLARFTVQSDEKNLRDSTAVVFDANNSFPHFGYTAPASDDAKTQISPGEAHTETVGKNVEYIPGIVRCNANSVSDVLKENQNAGIVVIADPTTSIPEDLQSFCADHHRVVIRRVDVLNAMAPADFQGCDIVIFDETFVEDAIPFAAFTTRFELYEPWMKGKMSMFHSTTFQPNTIASRHFMDCAKRHFPELLRSLHEQLTEIADSIPARHNAYRKLFSPSLSRLIRTVAFDKAEPTATGHVIKTGSRKIIDGVAGVACSLRGHNPAGYVDAVEETLSRNDCVRTRVAAELKSASGLSHFAPAVSGAAAVEHALKMALIAQQPRRHVVALRGGFGGKTLCALTGTSRGSYKKNIGPLFQDVTYVDPFQVDSVDTLKSVFRKHPPAVVQCELIQGVGGVRPIPPAVIDAIQEARDELGFLWFVDEVQTGMFRTGPFLRSQDVGVVPDLVSIGKGASDMMFPFAATLYNDRVAALLEKADSGFPEWLDRRYSYPIGLVTLLETLTCAREENWQKRVRKQGTLFSQLLNDQMKSCPNVKDVRVFGMLIGIELSRTPLAMKVLGRRAAKLYSLAMLERRTNPLLMGFCQYEPSVFKMTPGLLMNDDDIRQVCNSVSETLQRGPLSVLIQGLTTLVTRR